jgi:hypothetical protein
MSLTHRIEALESIAEAARATDQTEPAWAAALFMDELTPTHAYHAIGALLEAMAAGRLVVRFGRLAVDRVQPGASQEVCEELDRWCNYINSRWDSDFAPLDTKPRTRADYAEWLRMARPNIAFGGTLGDDDRAIVASDLPDDAPERMAIEARFVAWCNEMEIELEDQSNQSPAPAH